MRFESPLPIANTPFGPIPEPRIELPLRLADGYVNVRFFLDTGADVSMLPRSAAADCGVDPATARRMTVTGIERGGIDVVVGEITVRIGDLDVAVPCLFTLNEDTPPLLGRAGILDRFSILLDPHGRRIVLETVE